MASTTHTVKVLELCRVGPPPFSVPKTSLPLTFFDLLFLLQPPSNTLHFYNFPHASTHFIDSLLPQIKHSLSLTLIHFYPFAGNLTWSPESDKPLLSYVEGDSVSLTVAESDGDFHYLSGNHPRHVYEYHPLVPHLPVSDEFVPALAIQITLFPNSGISFGISMHHSVTDGRMFAKFMDTWASICRLGDSVLLTESPPLHDRTIIKDPLGIEAIYLKETIKFIHSRSESKTRSLKALELNPSPDSVRATFKLSPPDVARLRQWVLARRKKDEETPQFHLSTYVLACAYTWVCLVKAREQEVKDEEFIVLIVDCRARLDPPIPVTYFGNCVRGFKVVSKRSGLMGEDGIAMAADSISEMIRGLGKNGALRGAEEGISRLLTSEGNRATAIAGATRLGFYEADFGWGRPKKMELTSIDRTGAIFIAESSSGDGGVEITLVFKRKELDAFASLFANGIDALFSYKKKLLSAL